MLSNRIGSPNKARVYVNSVSNGQASKGKQKKRNTVKPATNAPKKTAQISDAPQKFNDASNNDSMMEGLQSKTDLNQKGENNRSVSTAKAAKQMKTVNVGTKRGPRANLRKVL